MACISMPTLPHAIWWTNLKTNLLAPCHDFLHASTAESTTLVLCKQVSTICMLQELSWLLPAISSESTTMQHGALGVASYLS